MNDDRNQYQIIRIDARNCFAESLSDAFSIGKAHLTFCSYDKRRPTGQRMTDSIQIYIDMPDWLELCRMLDSYSSRASNPATVPPSGNGSAALRRRSWPALESLEPTERVCPEPRSSCREAKLTLSFS